MNRRDLLRLAAASSAGFSASFLSSCAITGAQLNKALGGAFPFALGVASGAPQPSSVVLWTRLAVPLKSSVQIPNSPISVRWEISTDERFEKLAAFGVALALPELGHSLHIEPKNLAASRIYWYRFLVGDAVSAVGKTQTAPDSASSPSRLKVVLASCQNWEHGYFHAWQHAASDNPDVIVFTGDYIYEYGPTNDPNRPRRHMGPEIKDLAAYRDRYALYKSDPHLQIAHQAAPWIVTWDDHEVVNDYASDRDEQMSAGFMARRDAAYQAYWENLPLPMSVFENRSSGNQPKSEMRIYGRYQWGQLAQFHVLDDRQYRDYQACARPGRGGSATVWRDQCPELDLPNRSMLGATQDEWLRQGLSGDDSAWTIVAQQTLMAHTNQAMGVEYEKGRERFWTDGWNGYQPARERLLQTMANAQRRGRSRNPIVLGGDVHAWYLADLQMQADVQSKAEKAPVIATEICGSSISSPSWPQSITEQIKKNQPHMRYARSDRRGYTLVDFSKKRAEVHLRAVVDAKVPMSPVQTLETLWVENGHPGLQI
jgi:alkaline phosphatase D